MGSGGPPVRAARGRSHFCRPYGIVFYRPIRHRYIALELIWRWKPKTRLSSGNTTRRHIRNGIIITNISSTENLYSPHMVVKYNKNSNGTKKNTMEMQCKYKRTYMRLWFARDIWRYRNVFWLIDWLITCILRPDCVKKSTQQSLCINFVRRRSSATLGNVKLNCSW